MSLIAAALLSVGLHATSEPMHNYIGDTAHPGIYGYGYRASNDYGNSQGTQYNSLDDGDGHINEHGHTLAHYSVGNRRESGIPHDQNIYHPHPAGHNEPGDASQIPRGWHVENFVGHHKLVRDPAVAPLDCPNVSIACSSLFDSAEDDGSEDWTPWNLAHLVYGKFDQSTLEGRVFAKMRRDLAQTLVPYVEGNLGKAAHGEMRVGLLDKMDGEDKITNMNARLDNGRIFIYGTLKIKCENSSDNEDPARPPGDIDSISFNMDLDDELAEEVGTSMYGECKAVVVCDTCWYNSHVVGDTNTNMNHYHYELDLAVHNARRRLADGSQRRRLDAVHNDGSGSGRDYGYYSQNGYELTAVYRGAAGDNDAGMNNDNDAFDPYHENDGSFTWNSNDNDNDMSDDPNHEHAEVAAQHQRVMDYRDYHWDNYLHHWNQLGNRQEVYHWDWDARVWIHEPHMNYHMTNTDSALLTRDVCEEHPNTRVSMTLMNDETCVCQDGYYLYDNLYPVSLFNRCKGHHDHVFRGHPGWEIVEGHDQHHGHGHASPWNVPEPDAHHEPAVVEGPAAHHHGEDVLVGDGLLGNDGFGYNGDGHFARSGLFSRLFGAWNNWNYAGGVVNGHNPETNKSMIMVCMLAVAAMCAFAGNGEL